MWTLAYWAIARLGTAYLARGERGAASYARGSFPGDDFLPGLSDVDLALVVPHDPARPGAGHALARERWQRLRRAVPLTGIVLDYPRIYDDAELRDLAGASALTYGLDGAARPRPGYFGDGRNPDGIRMLERPGLYGATADWRLLSGPDRRPPETARDAQLRRIAAWLELVYWWRWVFPFCIDRTSPHTAHLCVKLVAEPARIWLWLAHGERASGRSDVLRRALRSMPEEEDALRRALDLRDSLPDYPDPPLAEALPVLVRLSARIAALIAAEVEDQGATEVRLAGADPAELLLPHAVRHAGPLPLCDWRSLVLPRLPDEAFESLPGDPGDPVVLGAAAASQRGGGPYPALHGEGLLVLPTSARSGSRLRAVQCPATDPVSFALFRGEQVARFPNVRGWSAGDTARRAVAEHRAWLTEPSDGGGDALGMLLTAARAALFMESLDAGDPTLPLTATETARRLAARSPAGAGVGEEALDGYRGYAAHGTAPLPATVAALRKLVLELPAYAEPERV